MSNDRVTTSIDTLDLEFTEVISKIIALQKRVANIPVGGDDQGQGQLDAKRTALDYLGVANRAIHDAAVWADFINDTEENPT